MMIGEIRNGGDNKTSLTGRAYFNNSHENIVSAIKKTYKFRSRAFSYDFSRVKRQNQRLVEKTLSIVEMEDKNYKEKLEILRNKKYRF